MQPCCIHRRDAISHPQPLHYLGKITIQSSLPTKRIHPIGEGRGNQFLKTPHGFDATMVDWEREGWVEGVHAEEGGEVESDK